MGIFWKVVLVKFALTKELVYQNKPCYLENHVVREPCKWRTACICKFRTNHNSFILSLTLLYEEDPFARSWPPSRRWRWSAAPLPPSGPWWTAASRTHHKAACLKVCVTRHSTVQHYQDHAATCIYAWATSSQRDPNHLKTIIFVA